MPLAPSMKPTITPGSPSAGVASNIIVTASPGEYTKPRWRRSRHHGVGYTRLNFTTEPPGSRCVSWSRGPGRDGS
jgi:hypothetical protein